MKHKVIVSETELQRHCSAYFDSLGYLTQEEVPFLFKIADLVCLNESTGECIAVEVKVKNWREALEQAKVYQFMADKVYIAIDEAHVGAVDSTLVSSTGIGLLRIARSGKVHELLQPMPSPRRIGQFTSKVISTVFPGSYSIVCLMS
ncbi:MAG: hypothetical protein HY663_06010 [Chloroflexi bacterium]|nr:hypothetical protein [Chloroflexota bacterium]